MTSTHLLASTLAVLAVLGMAGCGQQRAGSVADASADVAAAGPREGDGDGPEGTPTSGSGDDEAPVVRLGRGGERPELVCPTDERSVMIADFAHGAEGVATPQEAVGPGLARAGEQLVISARGTTAWVLRPDGTARMEIGLLHHDGWLLHQRTSCG